MSTMNVKDAANATVAIEKPLAPSRASAAGSRPVVLAVEDKAALDALNTALARLASVTLGVSEDRTFNATSAQSSALTGTLVRLVPRGADCRILIASNPTALAAGPLLIAGNEYYFAITTGHKVAAIRDAAIDGTLNITIVG